MNLTDYDYKEIANRVVKIIIGDTDSHNESDKQFEYKFNVRMITPCLPDELVNAIKPFHHR